MIPIINGGHIRLKRAGIKGLPDHLVITSPSGAIGNQIAAPGQDRHQHSCQPRCGRPLILALGFRQRVLIGPDGF